MRNIKSSFPKSSKFEPITGCALALCANLAACSDDVSVVNDPGAGGSGQTQSGGSSGTAAGSDVGVQCSVTPDSTWGAPSWDENTAEPRALRDRLAALTGPALMRGVETGAVALTASADLSAAYEAGTPSLASVTTTYFDGKVDDVFDEFGAAVGAGAQDLVDAAGDWAAGEEGGIWSTDTFAFNEGGLEIRQILDKGLFGGGALYRYAIGLTTGDIDAATIDALAAAFGANSALNPGPSNDPLPDNQNVVSANYVYRMGLYGQAKQALIDAKAYAGDAACTAERDNALQRFFDVWERGLFARFVLYSNDGATGVAEAMDDDALAEALNVQSEGIGLVLGFHALPDPASGPLRGRVRRMTDAQIASVLSALGVDVDGDLGDATIGQFVADPLGYASAVTQVEDVIAEAFDLSPADLESYREPTAG